MVIDTSALVAVLLGEPEGRRFNTLIAEDPTRLLSAASRVETGLVVEGRKGDAGRIDLERFLDAAAIDIVAVTSEQAEIACEAFRRYGKGRHPAGLNFGDVFAYALATATGQPLLFKGHDFSKTDVTAVVEAT
jgi:ribonuclease VapC